jgi:diguanylate cyclase (GGDEF)-like protein/PAS domain S-box-containing protein
VVEQSPVSVVITDLNGNIVYVNPKFSELTGYNYEEAIDQNPRILKSSQTKPETYRKLWNTILSGREWSGEICNRKKDGTLYWEMAYISPVMNPNGETTHFVAVKEDITERKRTESILHDLSLVDELSGLSNRRGFMLLAKQQIKVANRTNKGLILVYADLDRLKWINDNLGHKEGDRAIVDTAAILRKSFRTSDIVARLGGDEFVALSLEAQEHARNPILGRLKNNLEAHNKFSKTSYKISISIGIAHYDPSHPCTIEELLERGDKLMYEEKQKSRQQGNQTLFR